MNDEEYRHEFDVTYATRLNNLCPAGEPTPEQKALAFDEAEQHDRELKAYEQSNI